VAAAGCTISGQCWDLPVVELLVLLVPTSRTMRIMRTPLIHLFLSLHLLHLEKHLVPLQSLHSGSPHV